MPTYTYRCPNCAATYTVTHSIAQHATALPVACRCSTTMVRDYRTDKPQPAPMWPEHLNPSTGTVVRTERQLADDLKRGDEQLYARTGIEQNSVVTYASDQPNNPTTQ